MSAPGDSIDCELGDGVDQETRALAWQVVDFARTGSPLEFSDEVVVYVNGQRKTMSAADAAKRNQLLMQNLVGVVTDQANAVRVDGGTVTTPLLNTQIDQGDSVCGGQDLPRGFGDRESLLMEIALPPLDAEDDKHCSFLNVFSTAGVVDGLVLRSGQIDTPKGPTAVVPDVLGFDLASAEAQLGEVGFGVSVTKEPSCFDGLVILQTPTSTGPVKAFQQVQLIVGEDRGLDCGETPAVAAIGALAEFANGDGPPPPLADSVGLYVGNKLIETRSRDELANPAGWQVCATYAARSCPLSALTALAQAPELQPQVPRWGKHTPPCVGSLGQLPESWINVSDNPDLTFRVGSDSTATCLDYWSVQVWLTGSREVMAVNLLLGDP